VVMSLGLMVLVCSVYLLAGPSLSSLEKHDFEFGIRAARSMCLVCNQLGQPSCRQIRYSSPMLSLRVRVGGPSRLSFSRKACLTS
jgi:hypothetical protein